MGKGYYLWMKVLSNVVRNVIATWQNKEHIDGEKGMGKRENNTMRKRQKNAWGRGKYRVWRKGTIKGMGKR